MGNGSESRKQKVARDEKRFVGRARELMILEQWFENDEAPMTIFSVTGMGGIGKSSLLSEMLSIAREQEATAIWMDGRACGTTPSVFMDYFSSTLGLELGLLNSQGNILLSLLKSMPREKRLVIAVDNYEELALLESWFMEVFIAKLHLSGILIILASRSELSATWRTHPRLYQHLVQLQLQHFTADEITEYIATAGSLKPSMAGVITRMTDGHPLGLALAVEAADQERNLPHAEWAELSHMISARLLLELTTPRLHPMVEVLTLLETANQELLSTVLNVPVKQEEYHMLRRMSFIRSAPDGLALHDMARVHLMRDFRQREPHRMQSMRIRIAELLKPLHEQACALGKRQIARKMLLLCQESMLQFRKYADVSRDSLFTPLEPMKQADLPYLHKLLGQWCEYSVEPWQAVNYGPFLDELAHRCPEGIVIKRDMKGETIAMFITVLVHREISDLLLKYFPNEMKECFTPEELQNDPDESDTHFALLAAARDDVPGYTREELVGYMTLDRLSLLGDGARAILVATNPHLKLFLRSIGFQMRRTSTRACDRYEDQADVLELDLRSGQFGAWVMSLLHPDLSASVIRPQATDSNNRVWSEQEVRKMLGHLRSPGELQEYADRITGVRDGIQLQLYILDLLEGRIHGVSPQDQKLLHAAYWAHAGNPTAAAQECSMSRATFYRHIRTALIRLARIL
ncbi:ATP-binding protein [Paenibacillus polysaccharolyticus]|uniref:ATP-binding protein n=1 Tax=Paenibacillus polysaccharolyticus TaxID=582692 RepID=UPI00203B068E|nr:ATP-binding protein [Paenibacillus polysaccharolyticus]MCM3134208.1 ATP-binding protein [Paenibacillus polysaccharolyticus]